MLFKLLDFLLILIRVSGVFINLLLVSLKKFFELVLEFLQLFLSFLLVLASLLSLLGVTLDQVIELGLLSFLSGSRLILDLLLELLPPLSFSLDPFSFFVVTILEVVNKFLGSGLLLFVPHFFSFLSPFLSFFAVLSFHLKFCLLLLILELFILLGLFLDPLFSFLGLLFSLFYLLLENLSFLLTPLSLSLLELLLSFFLFLDSLELVKLSPLPLSFLFFGQVCVYLLLKHLVLQNLGFEDVDVVLDSLA